MLEVKPAPFQPIRYANVNFVDTRLEREEAEIDIEDIESCSDPEKLAAWYLGLDALYDQIRFFIDERRFAQVGDEAWFDAAAGKCGYLRVGKKRVEQRMLSLGLRPPYQPTDPRQRNLQILNEKVRKLKKLLKDHGIAIVEADELQ